MINGLGVLGWGVGGIEAEAAMLGQPVSMLVPQVVGFKLTGKLKEGTTATDLVLTVTEMLRKLGVVGKFVEFYGPGISELPLADRATICEHGSGVWRDVRHLPGGRGDAALSAADRPQRRADCAGGGVLQGAGTVPHRAMRPRRSTRRRLRWISRTVEPSVAGPKRPQDRVLLSEAGAELQGATANAAGAEWQPSSGVRQVERWEGEGGIPRLGAHGDCVRKAVPRAWDTTTTCQRAASASTSTSIIDHGSIVIAAITSCTNTSNPSVMIAAGLLAKKAVEKGLSVPPWVKTSLAPGSRVVTDYYDNAGLLPYLDKLRFNVVGYGCTTCIGNSGPLPTDVSKSIEDHGLVAVSVLSGNRNFEGRINSEVRANYLMSPPLVVAYALAGRIDHDFDTEPLGKARTAQPVYLQGHLADAEGNLRDGRERRSTPRCSARNTPRCHNGDAELAEPEVSDGRARTSGSRIRRTSARLLTSTACAKAPRRDQGYSRRAGARGSGRLA